jgi:hypothetical protein
MTIAVMLDLETLATGPDSVILTLGAVKFNPHTLDSFGQGLYLRINVDEQISLGRYVDDNTIEWWGKQKENVREEALGVDGRVSLNELHKQLNKFLVGVDDIWAQGPVFDIPILESLYRQMQWPIPWQYWQIRDSRTLFGVHGDPREKDPNRHHNAFEDALDQAKGVQLVYNQLNIQPRFA